MQMKKDLVRQLLKADVQVVSTESLHDDACSTLRKLKVLRILKRTQRFL